MEERRTPNPLVPGSSPGRPAKIRYWENFKSEPNNAKNMIRISKKFLLGIPLALISLEIYLGIIFGYFFGKFFAGKYDGRQRIKSLIFNIGNYRLHLHHWLICSGVLILAFFHNFFLFFPQFFFGILGGLIIQDLHLDSDWYRILIRK